MTIMNAKNASVWFACPLAGSPPEISKYAPTQNANQTVKGRRALRQTTVPGKVTSNAVVKYAANNGKTMPAKLEAFSGILTDGSIIVGSKPMVLNVELCQRRAVLWCGRYRLGAHRGRDRTTTVAIFLTSLKPRCQYGLVYI